MHAWGAPRLKKNHLPSTATKPNMTGKTINLSIESKLSDVCLVGHAVRGVCCCSPLDQEDYGRMEVCVVEAVTNAINHAYQRQNGFRVETAITLHEDRISFAISDCGTAIVNYAPRSLEFDPEEIGSIPENGMGLFIIETIMDEVNYTSADGRNTLSFCKYFPPAPA